ncbi:MAG: hypothetical protein AVDCRST_MAG59-2934, partial [uncultured Thermomicrobiales bacterium]
ERDDRRRWDAAARPAPAPSRRRRVGPGGPARQEAAALLLGILV